MTHLQHGNTTDVTATEPTAETVDRVAQAMEDVKFGFSMNLTRLVDGESTYTLTYSDGTEPLVWSDGFWKDGQTFAGGRISGVPSPTHWQPLPETPK